MVLLVTGWLAFAGYINKVQSLSPKIQRWDPFQLLEVSVFSSSSIMKRHYKQKSLQCHPDKCPSNCQKICEENFIDLTKAYKVYKTSIFFGLIIG